MLITSFVVNVLAFKASNPLTNHDALPGPGIIWWFSFFFKRYLSALKMTLTVQFTLVTVLLYACFCSASTVTGPETPLEQSDSHNTEVSGTQRLHLLGSLADSRISLAHVLRFHYSSIKTVTAFSSKTRPRLRVRRWSKQKYKSFDWNKNHKNVLWSMNDR